MFNEEYLDTLSSWETDESLCVCPLDTNGDRNPLCSPKEDLTCVNADKKPGEHVKTGSRDERSLADAESESVRERLRTIRQKRSSVSGNKHLLEKVR